MQLLFAQLKRLPTVKKDREKKIINWKSERRRERKKERALCMWSF